MVLFNTSRAELKL